MNLNVPPDIYNSTCPSRKFLELIGGKWAVLVICRLKHGACRTNVLMRDLDGVSQKMLTQTLREMESYGLIQRISYPEVPPRVEYLLTEMGVSLSMVVQEMERWIVENFQRLESSRTESEL